MVAKQLPDHVAAQRVTGHMALVDAQVIEQGDGVVGQVAHTAGGVDLLLELGFAETTLVGSNAEVIIGEGQHRLFPPGGGREVAVDEQHGFAVADLLLFSEETEMIPYLQGRVGWMQLASSVDDVSTTISGLEFAALVGVDMPVAESISIDVSGQFGWFSGGDLVIDGTSVAGTSRSGSLFSIRAGAFFFF